MPVAVGVKMFLAVLRDEYVLKEKLWWLGIPADQSCRHIKDPGHSRREFSKECRRNLEVNICMA